ncbi:MAG TPA: TIGR01777 family oxidoreductase [Acidobacteriaceae bacterium]|nr:TIGR01777 family oxidoreductase [Acidobacteriaceae bacterium]
MTRKLLLCGGTGLLGRALAQSLVHAGDQVILLVRRTPRPLPDPNIVEVEWHPERPQSVLDPSPLEGCYAAVHLSGANLGAHRWTPSYKRLIFSSRVDSARALGRIFTALTAPPAVVVAASGTGYYGDRGNELLTEASHPGTGFLAETCVAWEAATSTLAPRVVQLRFGVVLTARGGALPPLLRLFRLGLGGRLGNGRQWMSWLSREDAVAAIEFAIQRPQLSGAFNTTSPHPVTNAEFTRILGHILHRPTFFYVPSLVLRAALGEMAQETVLASARAVPERLRAAGFLFTHERLEQTISEMV